MYVKVERVEGRVISQQLHPSRPWILLGLREPTLFSIRIIVAVDSNQKAKMTPKILKIE
jgi:hypothetical protein